MKFPTLFGKRILTSSQKHAVKCYPNESVGVVVGLRFVPLKNIHTDPQNFFEVDIKEMLKKTRGEPIKAIIHSHPIDRGALVGPSESDMKTQLAWNIPFGIQLVNQTGAGNIMWWGPTVPILPYEDRIYISGVSDCYAIIRDYYKQEFDIELKDYARNSEWWLGEEPQELYLPNMEAEGFKKLTAEEPYQIGDLVLVCIGSHLVNHAVIYTGGDQCLHHVTDNLSRFESINRFIDPERSFFHSRWRHITKCEQ